MELAYESVGWICTGQDVVRRKYLILQRGTELHSMRYGEYFDQLMCFKLFEQGFVSWIHLGPKCRVFEFFALLCRCMFFSYVIQVFILYFNH